MNATQSRPFGAALRALRVAAGLSQEELAARAQLSQRTISDLERGVTAAPYRETVALLAAALDLSESDRGDLERAVRRSRRPFNARQEPGPGTADVLLATKLAIPPVRAALVPRPHLLERLQGGLRGPLTLLSAPAGSGKTTLLSAWRVSPRGRDLPLAWVSLDEADNDPTRFWRYVLTALDGAAPGVGAAALTLLRSADAPSLEAVLSALVNALTAHAADIVLMLDDYHRIAAEPIHRMLVFLVEHLPPNLHLLVATRADPPLPLARLRARGDVTELRAADLRFTPEETAAFLGSIMGLSFSPDEVAALAARTEGWIAGLQLAGLSLHGRSTEEATNFITAFTGSHRYIVDFLLDEVLLRQPEHVQHFLLATCRLDRLCAPLCAAVLGGDDPPAERIAASQEMLEALERNNVFLIALDDERHWYRYHYLFAEALRQRPGGAATMPDAALVHRRASTWFARQGLLHEAIDHALTGGWYEHGVDLIRRLAPVLGARGEVATISTWLQALPEAILQGEPELSLQFAWLLIDMHDPLGAEKYLGYAEAALEIGPRRSAPGQSAQPGTGHPAGDGEAVRATIAAGRAIIAVVQGDATRVIPQARAALAGLDGGNVRARSIASLALGLACLSQGAARAAADAFKNVAAVNRATDFVLFRTLAAVGAASAHRLAGALERARATYEEAIAWSMDHAHPSLLAGSLYTGLADILREQNELEAALDRATEGVALATARGAVGAERWIEWHMCNVLVLARIKQAQGDLGGALAQVQEAREQLANERPISCAAILAAFAAQLQLAQGDLDAAVRWVRTAEASVASPRFGLTPQVFVYAAEHLEIAPIQVLLAQGRATRDPRPVGQALTLLDQVRARGDGPDAAWLQVKASALQALARQLLGETAAALAALDQARVLAQPAGYIRLFADEGPPMADLLAQQHTRRAHPAYVAAIQGALGGQAQPDIQRATRPPAGASLALAVAEPLTEREREVLRLLAAGRSNPEIARALYVEVNTVKTHLKRLYGKLSVHSRVHAAQRARDFGLL